MTCASNRPSGKDAGSAVEGNGFHKRGYPALRRGSDRGISADRSASPLAANRPRSTGYKRTGFAADSCS